MEIAGLEVCSLYLQSGLELVMGQSTSCSVPDHKVKTSVGELKGKQCHLRGGPTESRQVLTYIAMDL